MVSLLVAASCVRTQTYAAGPRRVMGLGVKARASSRRLEFGPDAQEWDGPIQLESIQDGQSP